MSFVGGVLVGIAALLGTSWLGLSDGDSLKAWVVVGLFTSGLVLWVQGAVRDEIKRGSK